MYCHVTGGEEPLFGFLHQKKALLGLFSPKEAYKLWMSDLMWCGNFGGGTEDPSTLSDALVCVIEPFITGRMCGK